MYYTKYRPQKFSEIQKPNEVAQALTTEIKTGKTVHAYLFTGPRGVGKTTMARLLAKGLSCEHLTLEGDVCGECSSCVSIQNGSYLDLVEIDAASNRGIDDIRELRDRVRLLPAQGKKKIYIIDEVHMLTNEAFNALLKTLEEPPRHAVFILCTTELHKVPETIKSRCQVFKFKRASKTALMERLRMIADTEAGISKIALEELEKVAVMAGGAFRDAETILQQMIEGGVVGSKTDAGEYKSFTMALAGNNGQEALKILTFAVEEGHDLNVWIDGLLRFLRDALYLKMGFSVDYFNLDEESMSERQLLASQVTSEWLVKAVEAFNLAGNDLKTYSIPQLALEIAVVKMTGRGQGTGPDFHQDDGKGDHDDGSLPSSRVSEGSVAIPLGLSTRDGIASGPAAPRNDSEKDRNDEERGKVVEERWKEVVAGVAKINNSICALLKSGKPTGRQDNFVLLTVSYKFHKERLESAANRKIVEEVLESVFGEKLSVKCTVCEREKPKHEGETGELTDLNIRVPQNVNINSTANVIDVFDGGLPL